MNGILAQVDIGVNWSEVANSVFLQYGPIVLLVIVVLVYMAVTAFNINKRADKNEEFVLETAKEARENKDDLIKVKDEFHAFQVEAAMDKGVQLGRIDELSRLIKHNQDKYEEKEKIWNEERRQLKDELDRLSKELNNHREELNGKTAIIQGLELERDALSEQLKDRDAQLSRVTSNLETLIKDKEHLEALIKEQSEQIVALTKQLVVLEDKLKIVETPTPETSETKETKEETS